MAKQGKTLPGRRRRTDDSVVVRSAESLGRIIGSLQRQLDGAAKALSGRVPTSLNGRAKGDGAATADHSPPAPKPRRKAAAPKPTPAKAAKASRSRRPAAVRKATRHA